jgi:hypothetical protein
MTSKRSAFITTSAVIVLIGSGVNLFVALTLFMKFPSAPVPVSQSNVLQLSTLNHVISIVSAGFSCWGMVTAIGLLRLREWARISLIVLSGILLLMFVRSLLFMALAPDVFRRSGSNRVAAEVFEAVVILLAAFWLWFLNRRTIRAQFGATSNNPSLL